MPAIAEAVPSPCISICQLDPAQVCIGCGRSIAEIAEWSQASAGRKRAIVEAARQRRAQRPGRDAKMGQAASGE